VLRKVHIFTEHSAAVTLLYPMSNQLEVLGVPIGALRMDDAVSSVAQHIDARANCYVCAADMNSVMQAQRNPAHRAALRGAHLVIPDGAPLAWVSRRRGHADATRVSGPDFMLELSARGVSSGWRHYFYGGAEGVAQELAAQMQRRFPGLIVAGTDTPPFRPLTADEQQSALDRINAARPHVVWIGLGCPKQELWMHAHAAKLPGAVVIGVGAAFDFHSNRVARAPQWMRQSGLEWLHRLASEPRRLWRRYLILGPQFVVLAARETQRLKRLKRVAA